MLTSRDVGIVDRARKRSQQSREPRIWYEHEELGYNYRMSNICAAIGVGQLAVLPEILRRKRQIFETYQRLLADLPRFSFMPEAAYGRCTRWLTVVEVDDPDRKDPAPTSQIEPSMAVRRIMQVLEEQNIESRPIWKPMHLQPVFKHAKIYGGAVSTRLFHAGVCLPSGAGLTVADLERIAEIVRPAH